ncbi:hypothetical protein Catovirus_1_834 [Catovirus CTV1]|uniref:Uncharacterized protein n=1 Tax=Catovirus CTV1 TaxID=1977631 RepID=A0A1V0SAU2_9VIRU|nr:hypothetical protein Catovirus_1_834 [Catovirus CTV1]
MNRVNAPLRRNNDNDYNYNRGNNKTESNNFASSVKTMSHRTNRQNIGTTEFVGVPIRKIIQKNPTDNNNSKGTSNIHKALKKNPPKKDYESDNEYDSNDENNNKKQHPSIDNYVQYIKNNMLKEVDLNNKKSKKTTNYDLKSIDSEDNESDDDNNSDESNDSEYKSVFKLHEKNLRLSEKAISAEITSFRIHNKKEPIISNIHVQKTDTGLRFIFNVNSQSLKSPSYLLNYKISRNIFLATLTKKDNDYDLSRTIEYGQLQFEEEPRIKFFVEDIYSNNQNIQEIEINLLKLLDKKTQKTFNSRKHIEKKKNDSKDNKRSGSRNEKNRDNKKNRYDEDSDDGNEDDISNKNSNNVRNNNKTNNNNRNNNNGNNMNNRNNNNKSKDEPKVLKKSKNFRY